MSKILEYMNTLSDVDKEVVRSLVSRMVLEESGLRDDLIIKLSSHSEKLEFLYKSNLVREDLKEISVKLFNIVNESYTHIETPIKIYPKHLSDDEF